MPHEIELKSFIYLNQEEVQFVLDLRNSQRIREVMIDEHIITMNEQIEFIKKLRTDYNRMYFLVKDNGQMVGVCNLKRNSEDMLSCDYGMYYVEGCRVSKFVNPYIYQMMLRMGCKYFQSTIKKNNQIALNTTIFFNIPIEDSSDSEDVDSFKVDVSYYQEWIKSKIDIHMKKGITCKIIL